jgi:hypothetical protein
MHNTCIQGVILQHKIWTVKIIPKQSQSSGSSPSLALWWRNPPASFFMEWPDLIQPTIGEALINDSWSLQPDQVSKYWNRATSSQDLWCDALDNNVKPQTIHSNGPFKIGVLQESKVIYEFCFNEGCRLHLLDYITE